MYDDVYDDIDEEEMADFLEEEVSGEVGRLFRRGNRKRRRRILGSIFGGPLGALGALGKRRRSRNKRKRQRRQEQGGGPLTHQGSITPDEQRIQPFGMGEVQIAIAGDDELLQRVQKAFQPTRLVLGAGTGSLETVAVIDIKIGTESQLAGVGPVNAGIWNALAEDTGIMFDPAKTGQDIVIHLRNLDGVAVANVSATFLGVAAKS